jgi:thiol-disulfide isomerase/thioredoxin
MSQLLLLIVFLLTLMSAATARAETSKETPTTASEAKTQSGPKREYNPGKVLSFPNFSGESLLNGETLAFNSKRGHSVVVIFIASWCEPCQVLMPELKQLARKHSHASNHVYFVFAHDTKQDAAAFSKEHQLKFPALMANVDILTHFKNPELPSVYIGDKWGYLADRFIKVQKDDIDALDNVISNITAL